MNHANLLLSHARSDGTRIAVRMGERVLTYAEFASASETLAVGLRRAGIGPADGVVMFAENSIEHLLVYHAIARIGAIFAPVHPAFKTRELAYAVANAKPRMIITTSELVALVHSALAAAGHVADIVILDERSGAHLRFSDLLSEPGAFPPADVSPDQPLVISFTSGTSSLPKPVLRSHGAETWSATKYRDAWGFEPDDKVLVAMSLSWTYGLCSLAQTALAAAASVVLDQKFSPTRTLEMIEGREVTAIAGTMSMYAMILNVLKERQFDTSALRKTFLGGEPRNETVVAELEARLGLRLCEAWAMTESFPALAMHPVRDRAAPVASLGRLVPGVEFRLVDNGGLDVEDGEPGEAWVRSPGGFLCYNDEPELTSERRTSDGWIHSGDILRRDSDGHYFFVARQTDMIIRGGANISPAEIESTICVHPDVDDAIAFGLPDAVMGEMVVALVTHPKGEPIDIEELQQFLAERLAKFKLPSFLFQVERIPPGTTGKKNRTLSKQIGASLQAAALQTVDLELQTASARRGVGLDVQSAPRNAR